MSLARYNISISVEAKGDARETADILMRALSAETATVAQASTVSHEDDRVIVNFREVVDEAPSHGDEYAPPRADEPTEAGGREAVERLQEMGEEPTPIVPIVRALVALSAARARSGLSPRQRITIEVEPAQVHSQDELRHH